MSASWGLLEAETCPMGAAWPQAAWALGGVEWGGGGLLLAAGSVGKEDTLLVIRPRDLHQRTLRANRLSEKRFSPRLRRARHQRNSDIGAT